ncbi:MAG: hypothetical protein M1834_007231 [Cirrosporium novae-zelandiae]|nr:MAG: hypothetical protein M1834_007231 [Cirrosporium novae-zelandiae]
MRMSSPCWKRTDKNKTDVKRDNYIGMSKVLDDHIAELNNTRPTTPFFFLKPPSSILPPKAGPILRPPHVSLHHEVELALIMSRTLRHLHPKDTAGAFSAIGAYATAIDLTARNVQADAKKKGLPWTIAKGYDTFLPLSEAILSDKIPSPATSPIELWLSVNGKMRQQDLTSLMLFDIPRILSEISGVMTLEEGDVVLTGTPKGVSEIKEGDFVKAGMRIDGKEIEGSNIEVGVELDEVAPSMKEQ